MRDKKIAVHVTNEEQWNEVGKVYGTDISPEFRDFNRYASGPADDLVRYDDGDWGYVDSLNDGYELLEFNEWQARIKEDNMVEKIEVPQAVYDEFKSLVAGGATYGFMKAIDQKSDEYPHMYRYLFETESTQVLRQNQLNLAKVMASKAEFVPIEEKYFWEDNQGMWLTKGNNGKITLYTSKNGIDKLTESEIREKTSFDIDKLERK